MVGNASESEILMNNTRNSQHLTLLFSALSPSPPFPTYMPRLRLAAPLVPLLLAQYINIVIFVRATTFLLGFLFFGQPLLTRAVHWLSHRHPYWRQYLELRR